MSFLNLESFDENEKSKKQNQEDECKEYKEKIEFLQSQIKTLKEEFQQKLQEEIAKEKNEIYQQLYQDFQKKLEEQTKQIEIELSAKYEQEFNKRFQEAINQKEEEIRKQYQEFCKNLEEKLYISIKNYKDFIGEKLLESLETIFEVLSLDKNSINLVSQEIQKILEDFNSYNPIKIKVNPTLAEVLNLSNVEIEKSEDLNQFDFEIEFENFKVEKNHKEILKQVIDEIRREIKAD